MIKIDDQILKHECEHSAELGISVINQKNNSQNIKRQEKQPMIDIQSIYSVYIYILWIENVVYHFFAIKINSGDIPNSLKASAFVP